MNHRIMLTAVLLLCLGATLPAFAQERHDDKGGGEQQHTEHQSQPQHNGHAEHAPQPQHGQSSQHQHVQQAQHNQQTHGQQQRSVASNHRQTGGHYGRISDDHYRAHFGHDHSFHMMHPEHVGGYYRFAYGGYNFGYNSRWPAGWGYNDNFYIAYVNGGYWMYNLSHPGIHITLNLF